MKKQVTQYSCDECSVNNGHEYFYTVDGIDVCYECLRKRLRISLRQTKVGSKCQACYGLGKSKGYIEYTHPTSLSSSSQICPTCNGSGLLLDALYMREKLRADF